MKLEKENLILDELSHFEEININNGGSGFYWLGQVFGSLKNLCDAIQAANIECPVSVAEWN